MQLGDLGLLQHGRSIRQRRCPSANEPELTPSIRFPPSRGTDWPLPKLQEYFKNDTLALIGYGSQGHGQGLNARDNGINVIVGVREGGESWKQAQEDGWVRIRTFVRVVWTSR